MQKFPGTDTLKRLNFLQFFIACVFGDVSAILSFKIDFFAHHVDRF